MSEFNKTPRLVLLPAVDVAGGKAVRLTKGEAGTETNYGDPVEAAADWSDQGAEWIHLVDLDAAFGRGSNAGILKKVIRQVRGVNVELSGGIRDDASLEHALEIGAKRINLGTAALENPEWAASVIAQYGEAIAVGLDVRGTTLAARGWTQDGGDLWQVMDRLEEAGAARYVVTDVTKDGTLQGPNLDLLRQVMDRTHRPVVASGGISSLDDIAALRDLVPHGPRGRDRRQGPVRRRLHAARGTGCRRALTRWANRRMPRRLARRRRSRGAAGRLGRRAVGGALLRAEPALRRRRTRAGGPHGGAAAVPQRRRGTGRRGRRVRAVRAS